MIRLFARAQLPGEFCGGRARRGDAWLSSLGGPHHHSSRQGVHAHTGHVQTGQEGEAHSPAAAHGGRSARQQDSGNRSSVSQVSRVHFFAFACMEDL